MLFLSLCNHVLVATLAENHSRFQLIIEICLFLPFLKSFVCSVFFAFASLSFVQFAYAWCPYVCAVGVFAHLYSSCLSYSFLLLMIFSIE